MWDEPRMVVSWRWENFGQKRILNEEKNLIQFPVAEGAAIFASGCPTKRVAFRTQLATITLDLSP